jgi:hypothetical protein
MKNKAQYAKMVEDGAEPDMRKTLLAFPELFVTPKWDGEMSADSITGGFYVVFTHFLYS